MKMRDEGLRSEALREALGAAIGGKSERLEDLLCRHGGGADPRPNLRLAAAVGAEIAARGAAAVRLLAKLGGDDADPETPRVFLPIAAAYGWVALLKERPLAPTAWAALAALAADERGPVRAGTLDALHTFALGGGGALALIVEAESWLALEDLEARYSTTAVAAELLTDRRVLAALASRDELLTYLAHVMDEIAGAPRSAQRLESWRRLLVTLPKMLAAVIASRDAAGRDAAWIETLCASADQPAARAVLSDAILGLRGATTAGGSAVLAERLREVMNGSAKPLRDPSRLRPGTGRGKASRAMR